MCCYLMMLCLQVSAGHGQGQRKVWFIHGTMQQNHNALSVLWDSQFLNYDNYFVRKEAGCEDRKLMHCKPLTQILSFCITPLKKKESQQISSPLAVFLCSPSFLLTQSWLSFLWTYLPLQPAPRLYPAICMLGHSKQCSTFFLGILIQ